MLLRVLFFIFQVLQMIDLVRRVELFIDVSSEDEIVSPELSVGTLEVISVSEAPFSAPEELMVVEGSV